MTIKTDFWKQNYSKALKDAIYYCYQHACASDYEVYQFVSQGQKKRGLWMNVSERLRITNLQAHDYYYNTWAKRAVKQSEQASVNTEKTIEEKQHNT